MAPIRILHASDLHISSDPLRRSVLDKYSDGRFFSKKHDLGTLRGFRDALADLIEMASSYDPDILEQLTDFINAEVESGRLNGVIFTGDIATTGAAQDVKLADEFFNEEPDSDSPNRGAKHFNPTLAFIEDPVKLGFHAGNHDRFVPTYRWGRSGNFILLPKVFDVGGKEIDAVHFKGDPAVNAVPVSVVRIPTVKMPSGRNISVFVVTADFTLERFGQHEGAFGWIAQGKAHQHVIDKLEEHTNTIKGANADPDRKIIWACHYPPQFAGESRTNMLLDANKLVDAAGRAGAIAIITGHTHHQVAYARPGMSAMVLCCGTTTQHEPKTAPGGSLSRSSVDGNHFQIINIDEDDGALTMTLEHYKYIRTELADDFNVIDGAAENETNWKPISISQPVVI